MDGYCGYYAKGNNLDRERQILYDFTYMGNLKKCFEMKKTLKKKNKNKCRLIQRTNSWFPEWKGLGG